MRLDHRLRLALASAGTTGALLSLLFAGIVLFARDDALRDKRTELDAVLRSFTPPSDAEFDLEEFHSAHPELSASVFDVTGRRLGATGRVPPKRVQGFEERRGALLLGRRFRGKDVVLSLDYHQTQRGIATLEMVLAALWVALTLLVSGIAWASAQAVFRPLERLSAQALAMGGKDLSERLVTGDRAEFGAFARDLNAMLDRVEETVRRGERFATDAAHELRTPLALLRTRMETALLLPRERDQYEETLRRSVDEIGRLTAITESLLRSARGESAAAVPTALLPLVEEIRAGWAERFAAGDLDLVVEAVPRNGTILPEELRVVLDNLLANALRYAPSGSAVRIRLEAEPDGRGTRLLVEDAGPGIPQEFQARIFDRFVRADDSRSRSSGGAGIGLAVCRQIVEARGGGMLLVPGEVGVAVGCRLPS